MSREEPPTEAKWEDVVVGPMTSCWMDREGRFWRQVDGGPIEETDGSFLEPLTTMYLEATVDMDGRAGGDAERVWPASPLGVREEE